MLSPSKMFSCVDANVILRSPINDSKAKNHWSIGKGGSRFPKQKGLYCDAMYNLPHTRAKRAPSFGYGKKTDLQVGKNPHNVSPPPDTYNLNTFIDTNKLHNTGFNIAIGREVFPAVTKLTTPRSYIQLQPCKMPGPGTYEEFKINQSPRWTMRPRTSMELYPKTTQKEVPGPGAYQHYEGISPKGRYSFSKYKNSMSKTWNPKQSKRFYKSTTDVPGPGTYQPKNDIQGSGEYILSNNKSHGHRAFLMGRRGSFVDIPAKRTQTPGPGSYRIPSDFGIYDHLYESSCSHVLHNSSTKYQNGKVAYRLSSARVKFKQNRTQEPQPQQLRGNDKPLILIYRQMADVAVSCFQRFYDSVIKPRLKDSIIESQWTYFLSLMKKYESEKSRIDMYLDILQKQSQVAAALANNIRQPLETVMNYFNHTQQIQTSSLAKTLEENPRFQKSVSRQKYNTVKIRTSHRNLSVFDQRGLAPKRKWTDLDENKPNRSEVPRIRKRLSTPSTKPPQKASHTHLLESVLNLLQVFEQVQCSL